MTTNSQLSTTTTTTTKKTWPAFFSKRARKGVVSKEKTKTKTKTLLSNNYSTKLNIEKLVALYVDACWGISFLFLFLYKLFLGSFRLKGTLSRN